MCGNIAYRHHSCVSFYWECCFLVYQITFGPWAIHFSIHLWMHIDRWDNYYSSVRHLLTNVGLDISLTTAVLFPYPYYMVCQISYLLCTVDTVLDRESCCTSVDLPFCRRSHHVPWLISDFSISRIH